MYKVKKYLSFALPVLVLFAAVTAPTFHASADAPTWMNPDATIEAVADPSATPDCHRETITRIMEQEDRRGDQVTKEIQSCVQTGKDIDLAFENGYPLVRFHGGTVFGALYGESGGNLYPGTNYFSYIRNTQGYPLVSVADLSTALEVYRTDDFGRVLGYRIKPEAMTTLFSDPALDRGYRQVFSYQISSDMRYIAAYVDYAGIVKLDLHTGEVTKVYTAPGDPQWHRDIPTAEAISDNGRYVLMGNGASVIDTEGCGEQLAPGTVYDRFNARLFTANCPMQEFYTPVLDHTHYVFRLTDAHFIDDGYGLTFLTYPDGQSAPGVDRSVYHVTIHAAGYDPNAAPRLTYLALGDSYSSGEGDIHDDKFGDWYMDGTDGQGQCHLSIRSYPFLLRDRWDIPDSAMKSVACSGAKVLPDYYGGGEYFGQHNQLVDLAEEKKIDIQEDAIENFKPGILRQLDFVKKYKPDVVTFTGGGNDIGFGDIMNYCSSSVTIFYLVTVDDTCAYAYNNEMREDLNRTIDDQYNYNKDFIERLKIASPSTKIYTIGYPQFIAEEPLCSDSSKILDRSERTMIRQSVSRLNNVLKRVAKDTNTYFIDIENSLAGGEICEGSRFITSPVELGIKKIKDGYTQEAYHPNNLGNQEIANAIDDKIDEGASYQIDNTPLEIGGKHIFRSQVMDTTVKLDSQQEIIVESHLFKPSSQVQITEFSNTVDAGTVLADTQGNVHTIITIPKKIGVGVHLVVLSGYDSNDQPIAVHQLVRVISDIDNDIDGDGITDDIDECFAITEWYKDGKNICAAEQETRTVAVPEKLHLIEQQDSKIGAFIFRDNPSVSMQSISMEQQDILIGNSSEMRSSVSKNVVKSSLKIWLWYILSFVIIIILGILIKHAKHKER